MGSGYTRNDTSGNIANGKVIDATDLDGEFDAIVTAFSTSGHTHDGTAAEGGKVTKLLGTSLTLGDGTAGTDITVTFDGETSDGVLVWMEDEDYFKFNDDILMNTDEKLQFRDTGIYISSNADGDLDIVSDGTAVDSINIESAGGITLDAGTAGSGIIYEDDGTEMMRIYNSSSDVVFQAKVDAKDLVFQQYDGNEVMRIADNRRVYFYDEGGEYISSDGTDFTFASGNDINLTATTDINIPANVGLTFGDDGEKIEGDGTNLTIASSNNLTIDATGDIILDADGDDITLKNGSATFASFTNSSGELVIKSGSTPTTAMTFSGANVTFAGTVTIGSAGISEAELEILDGANVTTTELNILDGDTSASSTTVADADRVVFNDDGTMKQVAVTDLAAYFDDEITAMPNLTSVGTLTTLTVDNVIVNGTTIGHTDDTDLITLADGVVTVAGEISVTTLDIGGTNVGSTAAELNLLDGSAKSTSSITIADADAFIVIDGTTTKQIPASDIATYATGSTGNLSTGTSNVALGSGALDNIDSDATYNTGIGVNALTDLTDGDHNTALGYDAGANLTQDSNSGGASYNVLIGNLTGEDLTTGAYDTFVGYNAGGDTVNSVSNSTCIGPNAGRFLGNGGHTAIGTDALVGSSTASNNTGSSNFAGGMYAMNTFTTADECVAVGYQALRYVTSGDYNTAVGAYALRGHSAHTGNNNVGVGYKALYDTTSGSNNTALGDHAGYNITTGGSNVAIGGYSLYDNETGTYNVAVGNYALANATSSNNVGVGYYVFEQTSSNGNNTGLGYKAGQYIEGDGNIAIGYEAMLGHTIDTTTATDFNIAIGKNSLHDISTGANNTAVGTSTNTQLTTGSQNVSIGSSAGNSITTGSDNVCIGYECHGPSTGDQNVAVGKGALSSSLTGGDDNVAIGFEAMRYGSGSSNVAIGDRALHGTSGTAMSGTDNVAIGRQAGDALTTASDSVFIGGIAGYQITTGEYNVAVGYQALSGSTGTKNQCTAVGYGAGDSITSGSNLTCIGYNADASSATATNEITLGDSNVSTLRCNDTSIGSLSDGRDKTDIVESSFGLDFINSIRPVQFKWDRRNLVEGDLTAFKNGKIRLGFIAQELKESMPNNENDILDLVYESNPERLEAKYGNLIPILTKAIQDLSKQNKELENRIVELENK